MKRLIALMGIVAIVTVGAVALVGETSAKVVPLPIDCSTVLCAFPDCPIGTTPVILPGDCCHTCVVLPPKKGKKK